MIEASLRPAKAEDLIWLEPLYEQLMRPIVELSSYWAPGQFALSWDRARSSIIQVDGVDIGLLTLDPRGDLLYLAELQIHPSWQNRGIGTQLITDIIDQAQREHLRLHLRVLHGNPARALYDRLGFEVYQEHDNCTELSYQPEEGQR